MSKALSRSAVVATVAAAATLATVTGCASSDSGFTAKSAHPAAASTRTGQQAPIVSWFRQVNPLVSTVEQSITWAQWMVRRPTHQGLHTACTQIKADVAAVRAAPGPPDARARTALTAEMRAFDTAADQCLAGHLEAAGSSVDTGHRYAELSGRRIVTLLHAAS